MKVAAPKFRGIERLMWLCSCLCALMFSAANVQAAATGFLYALDNDAAGNMLYGFSVNEGTGALTALPGSPFAAGGNGDVATVSERVAIDRLHGRLFVVNGGSNTVSAFSIHATTGALTALPFSPISLGAGSWTTVTVHASGSPLVVGNSVGSLASFNVSATSATPAAGSPFSTGAAAPWSSAFSQDGGFVYAGGNSNFFAGFTVDPSSGGLTALPGSPYAPAGLNNPAAYATDTAGRLFMANRSSANVLAFVSWGSPVPATGNPFASGLVNACHGLVHPRGFYVVADRTGNQVGVYKIVNDGLATTLAPIWGSPFASGGTATMGLALSQSGLFLFAANGTSRNITTFAVGSSGWLTSLSKQPADTLGAAGNITGLAYMPPMALPPAGLLYTLNDDPAGNKIFGFAVNENDGALTLLNGFPIATGGTGGGLGFYSERLVLDGARGRLYAINGGSHTVCAYAIDPATGALTPLPFSPINLSVGDWSTAAVHPSGSPLVVGNVDGNMASFNITATAAVAADGSPYSTGAATTPYSTAFSRDGHFVYTGGSSSDPIAGFSVEASTGVLTALAGSPYTLPGVSMPSGFCTDSTGRLFVANFESPTIGAFTIDTGVPIPVAGNPFPSGLEIAGSFHAVLHPEGFYMVADVPGNQVGVYRISGTGATTTLAAVPGSPVATGGMAPVVLALNQSGTLLFAANAFSRNVSSFFVDTNSGTLSASSLQWPDSVGASGLISGLAYVAQPATIAFASRPLATPNPASVGQAVTFSAGATGGFGTMTLTWNFGDGTTGTGATVAHAYAAAGNYTAVLTATDVLGVTNSVSAIVTVNAAVVGSGVDSDGDGFSDAFETAVGTDPNNAAATPTGAPALSDAVQKLSVLNASIKLKFAQPGNDFIRITGVLVIPDGFAAAGQNVFIDIGGVAKSFVLGANGAAPKGKDLFAVRVTSAHGVMPLQLSKFGIKLSKGDFAAALADDGLINATTSATVKIPVTVIFNGELLQQVLTRKYRATAGKTGATR